MKRPPPISARKEPRQARSRQLRDDLLEASLRVLQREGPLKFNTVRVAEAAGVSVGSLYQYFPNKQALVFALHSRAVEAAWFEVERILSHARWSPREKVRRIARYFFRAESAETAELGAALQDAELFFEDAPVHREMNARVAKRFRRFVRDSLPRSVPSGEVTFRAQLLITTLESVGRAVAATHQPRRRLDHWATTCADMVSAVVWPRR